mmetsp:Transcript_16611/g.23242  ORF Transcript_16611/g.23242 Transcript_16611/m.23242 type:complete len:183 (+) Transcript_16611:1355-1903(+)
MVIGKIGLVDVIDSSLVDSMDAEMMIVPPDLAHVETMIALQGSAHVVMMIVRFVVIHWVMVVHGDEMMKTVGEAGEGTHLELTMGAPVGVNLILRGRRQILTHRQEHGVGREMRKPLHPQHEDEHKHKLQHSRHRQLLMKMMTVLLLLRGEETEIRTRTAGGNEDQVTVHERFKLTKELRNI